MRDLFAAARNDAPSDVVRDEVWGRVAAATSVPAAAAGAAAGAKAAAVPAGGKVFAMLAGIGAIGAAIAITTASLDLSLGDAAGTSHRPPTARERTEGSHVAARLADPTPRARASSVPSAPEAPPAPQGLASPPGLASSEASNGTDRAPHDTSDLAEEARLVTEARSALVKGEPERAYSLTRRTRMLSARALEPEELALEARALRAMGRVDEAVATELTLKRRYPNHALSR
jgi:hypothetical protein